MNRYVWPQKWMHKYLLMLGVSRVFVVLKKSFLIIAKEIKTLNEECLVLEYKI